MKSLAVLLLYHHIICVFTEKAYFGTDFTEESVKETVCSVCENAAGFVKRHAEPVKQMSKLPCMLMPSSDKCDQYINAFVAVLDAIEERNVCKMIKFCDQNEDPARALSQIIGSFMGGIGGDTKSSGPLPPLQLGITSFKADPETLKKVANKALESLGGTISSIGSLTNEGSQHLGKTLSNIPIGGDIAEKATAAVGNALEKITNGMNNIIGSLGGLMFGSVGRSPMRKRKQLIQTKRVRRSTPENVDELKQYIGSIDTEAASDAPPVEQLFSAFATKIKFGLLQLLEDQEEEDEGNPDDNIDSETEVSQEEYTDQPEIRSDMAQSDEEEEEEPEQQEEPDLNEDPDETPENPDEQDVPGFIKIKDKGILRYHPKNPSKTISL